MKSEPFLKSVFKKSDDYLKYNSYFGYILACLKSTSVWTICDHIAKYVRRYFLISRLIRYTAIVISIIEASAVLLIFFSALIVILPILLISVLSVITACFIQYKKHNTEIQNYLRAPKVYIFFSDISSFFKKASFLNGFANELSENSAVFIVSPAFSGDHFLTLRKKDNIYAIKLHYFYYLKFSLFKKISDKITYIY